MAEAGGASRKRRRSGTAAALEPRHVEPAAKAPAERSPSAPSEEAWRAHRRIHHLYEISKLLIRFESIEKTVPAVLAVLAQTLELRSIIFTLRSASLPRLHTWQADTQTERRLRAARAHAREAFAYLVHFDVELAGDEDPSRERAAENPSEEPGASSFVVLPLVAGNGPIFGALQLEAKGAMVEADLVYANAAINQLAIALARSADIDDRFTRQECRRTSAEEMKLAAETREAEAQRAVAASEGLNAALERLVSQRTAAMVERTRELARSNAELVQFAYVTSHDLKEPLRGMRLLLQLLQESFGGNLEREAAELLSRIRGEAARMSELIDALLAYAQTDKPALPGEPVELAAVLAESLSLLKLELQRTGCRVTHDPLPLVTGSKILLTQLFQNLLANAIKFRAGPGPLVHVWAEKQKTRWVVSVRDDGIGVDPKHADRIFQVFQRLHPVSEYPGAGIGLAICKKIVEQHHGRIWCEPAPGRGATFKFTLPAAGDLDATATAANGQETPQ